MGIADALEAGVEVGPAPRHDVDPSVPPDETELPPDQDQWVVSDGDLDDASEKLDTIGAHWIVTKDWRDASEFFLNTATGEASKDKPRDVDEIISDSSVDDEDDDDAFVPRTALSQVEHDAPPVLATDDATTAAVGAPSPPPSPIGAAAWRLRVMEEIVSSEASYVASVRIISDVFFEPFRAASPDTSVMVLLNNAIQICTLNQSFLRELQQRLDLWRAAVQQDATSGDDRAPPPPTDRVRSSKEAQLATVTDIFDEYLPLMVFYGRYSANMGPAMLILRSYKKQSEQVAMRHVLADCEAHKDCHGEPLESLLIKPIQRIPRYILLMTEMLKRTNDGDPDRERIQTTIKGLQQVADTINETVRNREGQESLIRLQKALGKKVDLVADGRIIVYEGELSKVDRTGAPVKLYWHLFNDMIMFSRQSPIGLFKHRFLDLHSLSVEYTNGGYDYAHAFMIKSPRKSFVVFAATEADTRRWFREVERAIDSIAAGSPVVQAAPMRDATAKASKCGVCHVEFTLINRRHYCRSCGITTCSSCCSGRVLIATIDPRVKQQVCESCVQKLEAASASADPPPSPRAEAASPMSSRKNSAPAWQNPPALASPRLASSSASPPSRSLRTTGRISSMQQAASEPARSSSSSSSPPPLVTAAADATDANEPPLSPPSPTMAALGDGRSAKKSILGSIGAKLNMLTRRGNSSSGALVSFQSGKTIAYAGSGGKAALLSHGSGGKSAIGTVFTDRRSVASELLRSEESYLAELDTTLEVLFRPLLARMHADAVQLDQDLAASFETLEQIHTVSMKLKADMVAVVADWSDAESSVGDVYTRKAALFALYAQYASHVNSANNALSRPDIEALLAALESDPRCESTGLRRRILWPLQRMSAYTFLLGKLQSLTPESSVDSGPVQQAIAKLASASKDITMQMKMAGNKAKIVALAAEFMAPIDLEKDGRELVRTGKMMTLSELPTAPVQGSRFKQEPRTIHLFNDRLLISKVKPKGLKLEYDVLADDCADVERDVALETALEDDAGAAPGPAAAVPVVIAATGSGGFVTVIKVVLKSGQAIALVAKEANQKRSWFNDMLAHLAPPHPSRIS